MTTFNFVAKVGKTTYTPKGFYYQGKYVILVGCVKEGHTVRRKFDIKDVEIIVQENRN
jgi:hypothetical protein